MIYIYICDDKTDKEEKICNTTFNKDSVCLSIPSAWELLRESNIYYHQITVFVLTTDTFLEVSESIELQLESSDLIPSGSADRGFSGGSDIPNSSVLKDKHIYITAYIVRGVLHVA